MIYQWVIGWWLCLGIVYNRLIEIFSLGWVPVWVVLTGCYLPLRLEANFSFYLRASSYWSRVNWHSFVPIIRAFGSVELKITRAIRRSFINVFQGWVVLVDSLRLIKILPILSMQFSIAIAERNMRPFVPWAITESLLAPLSRCQQRLRTASYTRILAQRWPDTVIIHIFQLLDRIVLEDWFLAASVLVYGELGK